MLDGQKGGDLPSTSLCCPVTYILGQQKKLRNPTHLNIMAFHSCIIINETTLESKINVKRVLKGFPKILAR